MCTFNFSRYYLQGNIMKENSTVIGMYANSYDVNQGTEKPLLSDFLFKLIYSLRISKCALITFFLMWI